MLTLLVSHISGIVLLVCVCMCVHVHVCSVEEKDTISFLILYKLQCHYKTHNPLLTKHGITGTTFHHQQHTKSTHTRTEHTLGLCYRVQHTMTLIVHVPKIRNLVMYKQCSDVLLPRAHAQGGKVIGRVVVVVVVVSRNIVISGGLGT